MAKDKPVKIYTGDIPADTATSISWYAHDSVFVIPIPAINYVSGHPDGYPDQLGLEDGTHQTVKLDGSQTLVIRNLTAEQKARLQLVLERINKNGGLSYNSIIPLLRFLVTPANQNISENDAYSLGFTQDERAKGIKGLGADAKGKAWVAVRDNTQVQGYFRTVDGKAITEDAAKNGGLAYESSSDLPVKIAFYPGPVTVDHGNGKSTTYEDGVYMIIDAEGKGALAEPRSVEREYKGPDGKGICNRGADRNVPVVVRGPDGRAHAVPPSHQLEGWDYAERYARRAQGAAMINAMVTAYILYSNNGKWTEELNKKDLKGFAANGLFAALTGSAVSDAILLADAMSSVANNNIVTRPLLRAAIVSTAGAGARFFGTGVVAFDALDALARNDGNHAMFSLGGGITAVAVTSTAFVIGELIDPLGGGFVADAALGAIGFESFLIGGHFAQEKLGKDLQNFIDNSPDWAHLKSKTPNELIQELMGRLKKFSAQSEKGQRLTHDQFLLTLATAAEIEAQLDNKKSQIASGNHDAVKPAQALEGALEGIKRLLRYDFELGEAQERNETITKIVQIEDQFQNHPEQIKPEDMSKNLRWLDGARLALGLEQKRFAGLAKNQGELSDDAFARLKKLSAFLTELVPAVSTLQSDMTKSLGALRVADATPIGTEQPAEYVPNAYIPGVRPPQSSRAYATA